MLYVRFEIARFWILDRRIFHSATHAVLSLVSKCFSRVTCILKKTLLCIGVIGVIYRYSDLRYLNPGIGQSNHPRLISHTTDKLPSYSFYYC